MPAAGDPDFPSYTKRLRKRDRNVFALRTELVRDRVRLRPGPGPGRGPGRRPEEHRRHPAADFAGRTVLHCHVLNHEDLGMMSVLQIDK
ncbi:multicopper oxidase domain-containing protein [Streptomyces sp. NPDC004237]|uniref:multicopper oxidase domain-containing protein n=1 Tax=Streptomyces sp. NPDC004237 TaxID=3154455 RepID=UPI0033A8083D